MFEVFLNKHGYHFFLPTRYILYINYREQIDLNVVLRSLSGSYFQAACTALSISDKSVNIRQKLIQVNKLILTSSCYFHNWSPTRPKPRYHIDFGYDQGDQLQSCFGYRRSKFALPLPVIVQLLQNDLRFYFYTF